jgi:lysophospholipase L1-like esterase
VYEAAVEIKSMFIDLNSASLNYINHLGIGEADKFNWRNPWPETDRTHLNPWGEVVFGRMIADII